MNNRPDIIEEEDTGTRTQRNKGERGSDSRTRNYATSVGIKENSFTQKEKQPVIFPTKSS
jgi:hypothetical protein